MSQPALASDSRKRILLADDDDGMRSAIRRAIEDRGWICDEAFNGVDSISKARANQPHLVILDLSMPIMNGYEASVVLRREMPEVPIVFLSMYAEVIGRTSAGLPNVKAVLSKADGLATLMHHVEQLLLV